MVSNSTSTIPVAGGTNFKAALKELAYRRRTSMAKLVRSAIDQQLGKDLEECLFFVEGVASKQQTSNEPTDKNHTTT